MALALPLMPSSTINTMNQYPKGALYMPKPPLPNTGVVSFVPPLEGDWLEYLNTLSTRGILPDKQRQRRVYWLMNPFVTAQASNGSSQSKECNFKHCTLQSFELQDSVLYRRAEKGYRPRYVLSQKEAFWIIAHAHSQLHHTSVRKCYSRLIDMYYSITEEHIRWVIRHCASCCMNLPNT
jgi:hypothetical protein